MGIFFCVDTGYLPRHVAISSVTTRHDDIIFGCISQQDTEMTPQSLPGSRPGLPDWARFPPAQSGNPGVGVGRNLNWAESGPIWQPWTLDRFPPRPIWLPDWLGGNLAQSGNPGHSRRTLHLRWMSCSSLHHQDYRSCGVAAQRERGWSTAMMMRPDCQRDDI